MKNSPAHAEIRALAYLIWRARVIYPQLFAEKDAQADWLSAEQILNNGNTLQIDNVHHLLEMATARKI